MTMMIFHAANLVLLLTVLVLVARKKIRAFYDKQHEDFKTKIRDAGAHYEKVKAAYENLRNQVDHLESRLAEMRKMSMKEIENESARIEAEADRQIQAAIVDGETKLRTEGERLKFALETELLDGALQMARKTLDRELKNSESEWLSQMSVSESGVSSGKKNYAS